MAAMVSREGVSFVKPWDCFMAKAQIISIIPAIMSINQFILSPYEKQFFSISLKFFQMEKGSDILVGRKLVSDFL